MSSDGSRSRESLREFSFGGVVVRGDASAGTAQVIVIVPRGKQTLTLPKGGADAHESGEATALREVREEAGVDATVRAPLGEVNYWYRRGGRRVYKTVGFYLCDYVSGSLDDHDDEVDDVRWLPLEEARTALSFPGEREMIELAERRLVDQARER
jgi:8-oxo-dGTP pyrophosphatase MutT (NUDIX family)